MTVNTGGELGRVTIGLEERPEPQPGPFRHREDDRARGVDEGGARGATVRHLAVPQEIKDEATGERLEVIQDDDPDLPPEPD